MINTLTDSERQQRPAKVVWLALLVLLAVALFAGFTALGVWQIQRMHWKLALIERVDLRVRALPVPVPAPQEWTTVNRENSEYRRVQVEGHFDHSQETLVRASTKLGRGFWVLTPLRTTEGFWVLINRGFVPSAQTARASRPDSTHIQQVTGLLRLSEPNGSLLQTNAPNLGLWYSRDVQAIASTLNLPGSLALTDATLSSHSLSAPNLTAPFFIDADISTSASEWPREGLTVISFNNHHLIYAMTWFVLAAMVAGATIYLLHAERQLRAAVVAVKPEFARA
jgi:surfeit locus 1 family protein